MIIDTIGKTTATITEPFELVGGKLKVQIGLTGETTRIFLDGKDISRNITDVTIVIAPDKITSVNFSWLPFGDMI